MSGDNYPVEAKAGHRLARYPGMPEWEHKDGDVSHRVDPHYESDGKWSCYTCRKRLPDGPS